jgi:hypothetical protein
VKANVRGTGCLSMTRHEYRCNKCGGRRQLYIVKGPKRLDFTLTGLVTLFIAGYSIEDYGLRLVVMYAGVLVVSFPCFMCVVPNVA